MRMTPRQAGKIFMVLGILWLIIAIIVTVQYGSNLNLNVSNGLILYGIGPAAIIVGLLMIKFGKR